MEGKTVFPLDLPDDDRPANYSDRRCVRSSRIARADTIFFNAMAPATVYLSLGSNLGDRSAMLRNGIEALANAKVRVRKISAFYETEPVDFLDQPCFLNCVVEAETNLSPVQLLATLRGMESLLGSKKEFAKGPRLLDMDILLYGDKTISLPELQIPHPRMLQRKFVLTPLAEIAPKLKHPSWSATAAQLLASSTDPSIVRKL